MKPFLDKDFLLSTETAKKLYHEIAEQLPILDYHCHLDPREIYEDRRFENITQVWLGGDHYKWRLMRSFGIEEKYITGDAADREKFQAWAETLALAVGNPLYHWSHLELKNYFGFEGPLTPENAEAVWTLCNAQLAKPEFSARNLLLRSKVEVLCTTDDPADSLEWHRKLAGDDKTSPACRGGGAASRPVEGSIPSEAAAFPVQVLPSYRPDKALGIEKADYLAYLARLSAAADCKIGSFASLVDALQRRLDFFVSLGCRVSDHGLAAVPFAPAAPDIVEYIFQKRLAGVLPSALEEKQFKTALLVELGRAYHAKGVVMQLHFGVIRDLSRRVYRALGPDAGIDAIGDQASISELAAFLNALDETGQLPKTVLYSLNPNDNTAIETVMGAFQTGEARGKLQHGSAWWFNDHKRGMQAQLESLAAEGHLATFVGMLTDSRSFLSCARHEYFRRIFCDLLGAWVENGEYPDDKALLTRIVRGVCYDNAGAYFGF
jgi:Glucuronate isomerase